MTNEKTRRQSYEDGLRVRREVLGAEHVDKSLSQVSEFSRPIQELVTEYCWGVVWTRDGLPRKTRSLINLAMLTALNRSHELGVHVRGALTNGATEQEIQEVLLQTAVYVGVPAALESFRIADRVLKEHAQEAAQESGQEPADESVDESAEEPGQADSAQTDSAQTDSAQTEPGAA